MKICIVATGGTIGSRASQEGIDVVSNHENDIIRQMLLRRPSQDPGCSLHIHNALNLLSGDIVPPDWAALVQCIAQRILEGYDGIVVTHGTDTMAYSLAAASFMLQSIKIPIVFTGALIPDGEDHSDAHQNLWDAILFARNSELAGVYLVFRLPGEDPSGKISSGIYWGPHVQSIGIGGRSFATVNNRILGYIENSTVQLQKHPFEKLRRSQGEKMEVSVDLRFDDRVAVVKMSPGFHPDLLDRLAELDIRAVIMELYHSGAACTREGAGSARYSIIPAVERLRAGNIAVFGAGAPTRASEQYRPTAKLVKAGLVPLGRMALEAAVVKAMCLIGRGADGDLLGRQMRQPLYHEIAEG